MTVNETLIYFHREKSELFGPPYFGLVHVVCLKNNRIDIDNCLKERVVLSFIHMNGPLKHFSYSNMFRVTANIHLIVIAKPLYNYCEA